MLMNGQIYKEGTLFFSQDTAATIAHVIPTMDRIDTILRCTGPTALDCSVKHAVVFARNLLDKYYSKTDLSNVYRIAMGEPSFNYHLLVSHPQQFSILK